MDRILYGNNLLSLRNEAALEQTVLFTLQTQLEELISNKCARGAGLAVHNCKELYAITSHIMSSFV